MLGLVGRRLLATLPVLLLASIVVFSLVLLIPGDPAVTLAGENASPAQIEAMREQLGLDQPLPEQYRQWITSAATGDLGRSLFSNQPVIDALVQRLPATASLAVGGLAITVLLGLPAGVAAAVWAGRWPDRLLSAVAALSIAVPGYFLGMLFVVLFANRMGWFPATHYVAWAEDPLGWARHLVLPWLTIGLAGAAVLTRQIRSSLIGVLQQDYVMMARLQGLRSPIVVLKHAGKNAAIPAATVLGNQVAIMLGGAVIIEQVFAIQGIGALIYTAVLRRDLPVIQGAVVFTTLMVLLANLLVDVAYGFLNPKVRVR